MTGTGSAAGGGMGAAAWNIGIFAKLLREVSIVLEVRNEGLLDVVIDFSSLALGVAMTLGRGGRHD